MQKRDGTVRAQRRSASETSTAPPRCPSAPGTCREVGAEPLSRGRSRARRRRPVGADGPAAQPPPRPCSHVLDDLAGSHGSPGALTPSTGHRDYALELHRRHPPAAHAYHPGLVQDVGEREPMMSRRRRVRRLRFAAAGLPKSCPSERRPFVVAIRTRPGRRSRRRIGLSLLMGRRPRLVGEHAAHERPALARTALLLAGGADRQAWRQRGPAGLDDRAVVEARAHRYLMLNTPESALDAVCDIIGSRSPSVLPLAQPGMVAVHALVPSKEVWRLLPELEAVGASSILVVPVERMTR